jgi:hypothetical protein
MVKNSNGSAGNTPLLTLLIAEINKHRGELLCLRIMVVQKKLKIKI